MLEIGEEWNTSECENHPGEWWRETTCRKYPQQIHLNDLKDWTGLSCGNWKWPDQEYSCRRWGGEGGSPNAAGEKIAPSHVPGKTQQRVCPGSGPTSESRAASGLHFPAQAQCSVTPSRSLGIQLRGVCANSRQAQIPHGDGHHPWAVGNPLDKQTSFSDWTLFGWQWASLIAQLVKTPPLVLSQGL